MTAVVAPAPAGTTPPDPVRPGGRLVVPAVLAGAALVVLALALVDLTLGTSDVRAGDLLGLLTGTDDRTLAVLLASRLPRVLAALLVGTCLGVAGGVLQAVARNPLASPDTLAVSAGGYLLVVAAAAFGFTLPLVATGMLAFVGGLAAAAAVLAVSRGGAGGPTRLVLAGSAVMLALGALTSLLLLVRSQETTGLFAWGAGSIVQSGADGVLRVLPVALLALLAVLVGGRRLDLLLLGDDQARVLGVAVRRTRVAAVLGAVVLSACAVTVAGPVGFVGLCAPVLARLLATRVPRLHRHRVLLPLAGLLGCAVVLAADVLLRLLQPGTDGIAVPTGVVTTVFGAVVLVWSVRRSRDTVRSAAATAGVVPRSARRAAVTAAVVALAVVATVVAGLLLGDRLLLTGDVANWLAGRSGPAVSFVLDQRAPRVLAALVAGAALGLAGTVVQAVFRNPLAEPGLLGITGGAGVGAVLLTVVAPAVSLWGVTAAAAAGAVAAFVLVVSLGGRGGPGSERLVLIGFGVNAAATALITVLVVVTSPWNTVMVLTWLSGSTYGRSAAQSLPALLALAVVLPLVLASRRELDLVAIDDDTPRVLGVPLGRRRLVLLGAAALLTACAVSAVGVVGFVGLVAPHLARRLVGAAHVRVVPTAVLVGALVVGVADTIGRTVMAPGQIPAGILTAVVGAPYFLWLLRREPGR